MGQWDILAADEVIEKTINALKGNGINADVVETGQDAKNRVKEMILQGSGVMTMTSVTLSQIGLDKELNESGKYQSVKKALSEMNRDSQNLEMQEMGAAPEYTVGSVHAVTEDGKVLIASNTGSQLAAYVYGSPNVIWIVSTKKIVSDLDMAMKRIYEYVYPLEDERATKAYGVGSFVSKLLIINREVNPRRLNLIFVKESLGF
jgi:hypothetical protein